MATCTATQNPASRMKAVPDAGWPDEASLERDGMLVRVHRSQTVEIAVDTSGAPECVPTVRMRMTLPDGKVAIADVSALAFTSLAYAIRAKHGRLIGWKG